ncbi:hypothetical protein [Methanobacterium ferruginis]|uniref:hypothetical protein n=1 Tax=Methanobacterium ferruginis TaxID=710191 RepID=UPI0025731586|nr:hypothetical protein [Methanobacterium ferruginis]BDZ69096.1 hypothetical protein GCM10025860_25440 [Methanobacterium ferruginis]
MNHYNKSEEQLNELEELRKRVVQLEKENANLRKDTERLISAEKALRSEGKTSATFLTMPMMPFSCMSSLKMEFLESS